MGERYMPQEEDSLLGAEHLHRYRLAAELTRGKKVLDAACGEGYGSRILAGTCRKVLGVDSSREIIDRAAVTYAGRNNLEFRQMNVTGMQALRQGSFEAVVSFETMEHLRWPDQDLFLAQIRRVLAPEGLLIISTPNRDVYDCVRGQPNPYHLSECSRTQFEKLLRRYFLHIHLLGQNMEMTGLISDGEGTPAFSGFRDCKGDPLDQAMYLIALCSNARLPRQGIRSVYMSGYGAFLRSTLRIRTLQEEEEERNRHILKQDALLEEKGRQIRSLQGQLGNILDAVNKAGQTDGQKAEVTAGVDTADAGQEMLRRMDVSRVIEEYLRRAREREESLRRQLADSARRQEEEHAAFETVLARQEQEIQNQQGHIQQLIASEQAFDRIRASRSYRLGRRVHRISQVLLAPDSTRRFAVHVAVQAAAHPVRMARFLTPHRIRQFFRLKRLGGMRAVRERYAQLESRGYVISQKKAGADSPEYAPRREERCSGQTDAIECGGLLSAGEEAHIHFPGVTDPEVSIIIPVWNHFEDTWQCLKSLEDNVSGVPCEILIGDDRSDDQTTALPAMADNIQVFVNQGTRGFVNNCNQAAAHGAGKYLVFLNNDTIALENWLGPMLELMEKDSRIGIVGAKLLGADGKLSEAGGIIWRDASGWNYGRGQDPEDPEYNFVRDVDYVSGACLMIRRELFRQLGGFDRYFAPAYYEDTDLAFRARQAGFRVVYQPLSRIVHLEGRSNGTDPSGGLKAWQVINRGKFLSRWRQVLEKEHFPSGEDVFLSRIRPLSGQPFFHGETGGAGNEGESRDAREAGHAGALEKSLLQKCSGRHILVVDHYVPHYDHDAGGRCTFMWIRLFLRLGMQVTFIGDNYFRHEPYTTLLGQMGVEVLYGDRYYLTHEQWLKDNLHYFDYCYLQRPHIAIKYIDLVRKYGKCRIFYFAHDLHALRLKREYELTGDRKSLRQAQDIRRTETQLFTKADVVHVVGSVEQEILQTYLPQIRVRNIPLYIYEHPAEKINRDFTGRKDLLFVGGFSHTPNVDGVLWFASRIWPLITRQMPDVRWHIVGAQAPDQVLALAGNRIVIHGAVSDQQLEALYRTCRMAVVPLRYGAGVKGKVLEAAYYQLPLVTTTIGAEGIRHEDCFAVEDDPAAMAQLIVALYQDTGKLEAMSVAGRRLIEEDYSIERAESVLAQDL